MSSIDQYLDMKEKVSDLSYIDLQQFIVDVENYYITYRDFLNLPVNLTFGTEIEYENISKVDISIYDLPGWYSDTDGSLFRGGELRSPILNDTRETWEQLATICKVLREKRATTIGNAGGHIHFGTNIFEKNSNKLQHFLTLIILYENLLYRFAYGDKVSARKRIEEYAMPLAQILYRNYSDIMDCESFDDILCILPTHEKYVSVNFRRTRFCENSKDGTVEFRFPNGSTEEIIWQNHINVFAKLIMYSISNDFDLDFINYKISKLNDDDFDKLRYNEICLRQALEFSDLIFKDNLDKINFLRQYIKSFENNYGIKEAVLSKRFFRR